LGAGLLALPLVACSHDTVTEAPTTSVDPEVVAARQQFDSQPGWRPFLDTLAKEGLLTRPEDVPLLVAFFQSDCRMQRQYGWAPKSDVEMQLQLAKTLGTTDIGLPTAQHVLAAEKDLCAAQPK